MRPATTPESVWDNRERIREILPSINYEMLLDQVSGEFERADAEAEADEWRSQMLKVRSKSDKTKERKPRGRRKKYKASDDEGLLRDWAAAKAKGSTLQVFCDQRGKSPVDLQRAQARDRKRRPKRATPDAN